MVVDLEDKRKKLNQEIENYNEIEKQYEWIYSDYSVIEQERKK